MSGVVLRRCAFYLKKTGDKLLSNWDKIAQKSIEEKKIKKVKKVTDLIFL